MTLPGKTSSRLTGLLLASLLLVVPGRAAPPHRRASTPKPHVPTDAELIASEAPHGLGQTDYRHFYPDASLADFSSLLQPPAGRFGFLRTGDDSRFRWADGRRARFWGVCISRRSVQIPHAEIARVAGVLARSGCNLVRFEALDGKDGILSGCPTDTRHLNAAFLDSLQFWLACLRARGIYYYLDLLDFRTFLPGDGVENAEKLGIAARPYAVFDPTLIALQKEFAQQFLTARNPYTHLTLVEDPALVMVELVNEHGLFMSVTELTKLAQPYAGRLQALWNQWLIQHYGTRNALADHWQAAQEPLKADEDPAASTVELLPMPPSESGWGKGGVKSARVRDQVVFLADTQRKYFADMRDYLRGLGLKCPITAAVSSVVAPDALSVADTLDCTAENYYADHPKFAGKEWTGRSFRDNQNPIAWSSPYSSAPQMAVLRWNNKPVVIREWCTTWPNRFRATSVPDMAAYASLQDLDMVILFTYVTGPQSNRILDFAVQSDPTVWGLFGAGAEIFLKALLLPARYHVNLVYSPYDLDHWGPFLSQLHRLAWVSQVRNVAGGDVSPPTHGISVTSGRGGAPTLPSHDSLLFQRLDAVPPGDRVASVDNLTASNGIAMTSSPLTTQVFRFDGLVYGGGSQQMDSEVGFLETDLSQGHWRPVGTDAQGQMAFGAYSTERKQLLLPLVQPVEGLRAALDLLHVEGADTDHDLVEADRWRSDTGQILRDCAVGRLDVSAPDCAMTAGQFAVNLDSEVGELEYRTGNAQGSLVLVSLDGRPIGESDSWVLKMVTQAGNTGQEVSHEPEDAPAEYAVASSGTAPVVTGGEPSPASTAVWYAGRRLVEVAMTGGTWELRRDGVRTDFNCDTPGVAVRLGGGVLSAIQRDGRRTPLGMGPDGWFVYPGGVLGVELRR